MDETCFAILGSCELYTLLKFFMPLIKVVLVISAVWYLKIKFDGRKQSNYSNPSQGKPAPHFVCPKCNHVNILNDLPSINTFVYCQQCGLRMNVNGHSDGTAPYKERGFFGQR